jgi:hypothetical protein
MFLLFSVSFVNCNSDDREAPSTKKLENLPEWTDYFIDRVPYDVDYVMFLDVKSLRTDPTLKEAYSSVNILYESIPESQYLIHFDQIQYWCMFEEVSVNIVVGESNLIKSSDYFTDNGWEREQYINHQIWKKNDLSVVYLEEDQAIFGTTSSIHNILKNLNEKKKSLYDNVNFVNLMSRLTPDGMQIEFQVIPPQSPDIGNTDTVYAAIAFTKENEHTIRLTYSAISDVSSDAENTIKTFAESYQEDTESLWSDINISNENSHWKLTMIRTVP